MSWLVLLGIAVVIATITAFFSFQPEGARPVAGTRMMSAARFVAFAVAGIFLLLAVRGYFAS